MDLMNLLFTSPTKVISILSLATIHLRPVSGNYQIIWMNKSDQLLHIISAKNDNECLYDRVE